MLKQKISRKEWDEIGIHSYAANWVRPLCTHLLVRESDGRFKREQRIGWLAYIVLIIPAIVIQFFWCCWDGGLKEFEFPERYLGGDWFTPGTVPYDRSLTVWFRHN